MSDENVHRNIRELRIRLGMTQEEFAHAVAVTFSTVNRWENGHAKPSKLARRAIEALARRGNPRREATSAPLTGDRLTPEAMVAAEPHQ
jgi:DNA-binding transcriptional regulator YiaG